MASEETDDEELRQNVQRLLQFSISQAAVPIDEKLIQRAVTALACPVPLSKEDRNELWSTFNQLAGLVHPAMAESVKAIQDLISDQQERPAVWRNHWKDPVARRQISGAITWVVLTLVVLVIAQFYTLTLSSILENLQASEVTYETAVKEVDLIEQTLAATPTASAGPLQKQRDQADRRKTSAGNELDAGYSLLSRAAFWVSWIAPAKGDDNKILLYINARNVSEVFLKGFALYLVPLLYGLLGANVYILRQLILSLDNWDLRTISTSKYNLRRALGALVGATVGLLFDSADAAVASTGFSLAALAFLGGYSAEFFFTLADSAIERAKGAFASEAKYSPKVD